MDTMIQRGTGERKTIRERSLPGRVEPLTFRHTDSPQQLAGPMDDSLYFTDHHREVREMVREFSRTQIAPVARELDETSTFPWDNIKAMGELGLLGVPWSEELGGAGMDQLSYYITIHEMAKVDASHALTISAHTNLGTSPIVEFGTEEQKRRYVPLLASGRVLGGFGLTEPGAGSDAGGTATTAVDKGDHYLVNGSKIFITHAGVGEIFVITARTEPGRGEQGHYQLHRHQGHGGSRSLPPDRNRPCPGSGQDQGRPSRKEAGQDGLACERHPGADVRGCHRAQGKPPRQARLRIHQFPEDAGCGPHRNRGAVTRDRRRRLRAGAAVRRSEEAVRPADRKLSGRELPACRHGDGGRSRHPSPVPRCLAQAERRPFKKEAAMAKLYCSELAMRTTTKAVQIFGGYGYTTEYPVERMMRDAKVCEIGEGTSEIQRIVIGRHILGEMVD